MKVASSLGPDTEWVRTVGNVMRRPGYMLAAWVLLTLALTANTIAFAVLYGFSLRSQPYPHARQLSVIREAYSKVAASASSDDEPDDYLTLRKDLVNEIAVAGLVTSPSDEVATLDGQLRLLHLTRATPSFFRTLGVKPMLGRLPSRIAGTPGGVHGALISWRLWHRVFNGNRRILGNRIRVGGKTYPIVGVMPKDFYVATGNTDAWLPFVIPQRKYLDSTFWIAVRRKPGVTRQQLDLALANYRQRILAQASPMVRAVSIQLGFAVNALPWRDWVLIFSGVGETPWLLQGLAGLLLLLALANLANLGLVKQQVRQHSFAIRQVLGAKRIRLVGLILIEHVPIVLFAYVSTLAAARWGIDTLRRLDLLSGRPPFSVTLGLQVAAFTGGLAVLSGLVLATAPAWMVSRPFSSSVLGEASTASGGRRLRWVQRIFGVLQIALAYSLLVVTGLLGASLAKTLSRPLGFDPRHRIVATLQIPHGTSLGTSWRNLKPHLKALPGVRSLTSASMVPLAAGESHAIYTSPTRHGFVRSSTPRVGAGFFKVMGIKLLAGQGFTPMEIAGHVHVVIVSEDFARKFFGSARFAIGKSLPTGAFPIPRVIGVARNVRWDLPPDPDHADAVYRPFGSGDFSRKRYSLVLDAQGSVAPLMALLPNVLRRTVPGSVLLRLSTLSQMRRDAFRFRRMLVKLVGLIAGLALLLATLGTYAMTTFNAHSRLMEYGIRMALGAGKLQLLHATLRELGWLVGVGLPFGVVGAAVLGHLVTHELYRTSPLNPGLDLVCAIMIVLVVTTAALIPARYASRASVWKLLTPETRSD